MSSKKLNLIILFLARSTLTQRKITTMIRITLILATVFSLAFTQVTAQNLQNLQSRCIKEYQEKTESLDAWCEQAAQKGDAVSQTYLGFQYMDEYSFMEKMSTEAGWTEKDFEADEDSRGIKRKALMWYIISSTNGFDRIKKGIDNISSQMSAADISKATAMAKECMASDYNKDGRECHWDVEWNVCPLSKKNC